MTDAFNKDRLYAENQDLRERITELKAHNLGLTKTLVELEQRCIDLQSDLDDLIEEKGDD